MLTVEKGVRPTPHVQKRLDNYRDRQLYIIRT